MKNYLSFVFLMIASAAMYGQQWTTNPNPLSSPAPNAVDNAVCKTNGLERITVIPDGRIGMGTTLPRGRMELSYCPNSATNYPGLIVNRLECANLGTPLNPQVNPALYGYGTTTPVEAIPNFLVNPGSYNIVAITNTLTPYVTADQPLFWVRNEQLGSNMVPVSPNNNFESRLVVMPNGNTGINTSNPRAGLDVRVQNTPNTPAAIFGSITPGTYSLGAGGVAQYKTQCIQYIPRLATDAFNKIVQANDQGIFFSDGKSTEGANLSSAFVIAPWSDTANDTIVGGLRMDYLGNTEIHGKFKATKINVNAKWWADDVFVPTYNLLPLHDLEAFITRNKHLPDVPAEKEILENGIDVSDMLAIQMKKTEELTLYIIELQKKIDALNTKLEALNK